MPHWHGAGARQVQGLFLNALFTLAERRRSGGAKFISDFAFVIAIPSHKAHMWAMSRPNGDVDIGSDPTARQAS